MLRGSWFSAALSVYTCSPHVMINNVTFDLENYSFWMTGYIVILLKA